MNEKSVLIDKSNNFDRFMYTKEMIKNNNNHKNLYNDIINEINSNNNNILSLNNNSNKINKNSIITQYKPLITLDTPNLSDNFYYNIFDWSNQNEIVLGISNNIHILNPETFDSYSLYEYKENELITSLKFNSKINLLACGTEDNKIDLFDYKLHNKIRTYKTSNRSSSIEFTNNILFEGNKNGQILIRDIRSNKSSEYIFNCHHQEIVKLKLNKENNYLASGGNDNLLNVLDIRSMKFIFEKQAHMAAIKALSWSKKKSAVLVSGGGIGDNKIKVWNVNNNSLINKIDTKNQVCNIDVLPNNQLISTHGFEENKIEIRELDSLETIASFKSHDDRIIYYASNFNKINNTLKFITGSSDKTIKIWNWKCDNNIKQQSENINFLR